MKKTILILGLALVLVFMITLTASATPKTYIQGFYLPAEPPYDYCFTTGENFVPDWFFYGCGTYITDLPGLYQTSLWDGWVDGKYGTCIINVRFPINNVSHVTVNQCTGDLYGFHAVAEGEFVTFTWDGWYHWELQGD